MPDIGQPSMVPVIQQKGWTLGKTVWAASGVVLAIFIIGYFLAPSRFLNTDSKTLSPVFILSLKGTVTSAEGIPYSGTVLYDTASETYSYIATEDEGLVTPIEPNAFSSGTYYLAMRAGNDSNDFVLYDSSTLAPIRVIEELPMGGIVTSAVWSPDGETFAYLLMGIPIPALVIDHVDATIGSQSPGFDWPLGFSPDGSKILTRGVSAPVIITIADGSYVETSGASFTRETKLMLSPSREYLVAVSDTKAEWHVVDWDANSLSSVGEVSFDAGVANAIFGPSDSLLVLEEGSKKARIYSYEEGKGVVKNSSIKLSLPEGARILHIASW